MMLPSLMRTPNAIVGVGLSKPVTTERPTDPRRAASRALNINAQGRNENVIREELPGDEGQGETPPSSAVL